MSRLLLVGWDAADWKIIEPLMARGEMPTLAGIVADGVRGNIATLYPPLSPMLWTSICTGKRPMKHGIHGFAEPAPSGLAVRPVTNLGRTTNAVWNILQQNGLRSIVVGWWPSHPAEPISGVMVSNAYPPAVEDPSGAPMAPGTVWPPAWRERLTELRTHGMNVTGEILRMFVPDYKKVDQKKDKSLHDLAGIIADTMSIHAAATDLIESEPWDFAAVYYSGIDHFSHRFMTHHATPSTRNGARPSLFQDVVVNAYRYHDAMLCRLLQLSGPDCAVMLVSDHGFHSDRLLPDYIPAEAAGPAIAHRHFGIFCMRAPGVPQNQRVYGASVLDITPTVLHLFGLPAGRDMDGRVLISAFADQAMLPRISSWDEVPGDNGRHPTDYRYDGIANAESLKQLVALGYISSPGGDARKNVDDCVAENRYNLARAWIDGGRPDRAAEILRDLISRDSAQARYHLHLVECLLQLEDWTGSAKALDGFDRSADESARQATEDLASRRAKQPDHDIETTPGPRGNPERRERQALAEAATGYVVDRLILRCRLNIARPKRRESARALLEELAAHHGSRRSLAYFLAEGFLATGDGQRALQFIRGARRADREDWLAIALEARIHERCRRFDDAVNCAIESLALVYFQPAVHLALGRSLAALDEFDRAENELRIALIQAPGLTNAHEELASLLKRDEQRAGEAAFHLVKAEELRNAAGKRRRNRRKAVEESSDPAPPKAPCFERLIAPSPSRSSVITIVSGLPRSGTSMMMQLLVAGGIEPYRDELRPPDADNPRGYFEHIRATRLNIDQSWLPNARGRAVKIVAHLLPQLPPGEEYRVIFLHRDLREVVASQRAMLERLGESGAQLTPGELMGVYTTQMVAVQNWLPGQPGYCGFGGSLFRSNRRSCRYGSKDRLLPWRPV